jgi:hypothetical protein
MFMKKRNKKVIKNKVGCNCGYNSCGCGGAVYGLGFIGAAVYYISNATGFWMGILGFLKAIVWPAFLVHGLLKSLALL